DGRPVREARPRRPVAAVLRKPELGRRDRVRQGGIRQRKPENTRQRVGGRQSASLTRNTFANAAAEGVKGKVVAAGSFDSPGLILSRPDITSIKMLEGQKMAAAALGSMEYTKTRRYLRNA